MSNTTANNTLINDVTGLNPIEVAEVLIPQTTAAVQQAVREHAGPISIGGGRFSMGGQIATEKSLHLDMRCLNKILDFSAADKTITVQAGIRWRDIQAHIDPHDLAVKIMQTYSNFTVGGSLSVNSHGRYVGQGPLVLSVNNFKIILANGELVDASPTNNTEIFYGAIGGYGGLGVIVEVTLQLVVNTKIECKNVKLETCDYKKYFFDHVRQNKAAVFHNADVYPPHYTKARAITWVATDKPLTVPYRLRKPNKSYAVERYFVWAISSTFTGKWRREHLIDPLLFATKKVSWRNYEAGSYDVAELEPRSRKINTYVLQEYFIPVQRFDEFLQMMRTILQRYNVNMLNISIRHAYADPGTLLAWAKEEVFAFVLYYKQKTDEIAKNKVAIWTRELIDAANSVQGSYYLPYQLHATPEQFHRSYPRAQEYFALKQRLDPQNKFRNKLWDKYYCSPLQTQATPSVFRDVFLATNWRDKFYLFLQNIYNIYPENPFHYYIWEAAKKHDNDKDIYEAVQKKLPSIKPFLADIRYTLPALLKQKKEMAKQAVELLGDKKTFDGYAEIGSMGRYVNPLKTKIKINAPIYLIDDQPPGYSVIDIAERVQIGKLGTYVPFKNHREISSDKIPDNSVEFVSCFIGLHHAPLDRLDKFVLSIARILKPGGVFILRDHDVDSVEMFSFVSLVHTVYNAGLGVSWEQNLKELKHFTATKNLIIYLEQRGLKYTGRSALQDYDPSKNTLLMFVKESI